MRGVKMGNLFKFVSIICVLLVICFFNSDTHVKQIVYANKSPYQHPLTQGKNHPASIVELDSLIFSTFFSKNYDSFQPYDQTVNEGLIVDAFGNSYIVGWIDDCSHTIESFLVKFDPDGKLLFRIVIGNEVNSIYFKGIALDQAGNIWVACNTNNPSFFSNKTYSSLSEDLYSIVFIQFSPNGDIMTSTLWEWNQDNRLTRFFLDTQDNLYFCGTTLPVNTDLPPRISVKTSLIEYRENFIASLTSTGKHRFVIPFLDDKTTKISSMVIDSQQNIIIGGSTSSEEIPLKESFLMEKSGDINAFLSKFNSSGSLIFSTYFGGKSASEITSIAIGPNDEINVVGQCNRSDGFPIKNSFFASYYGLHTYLFSDIAFIARFSSDGCLLISDLIGAFYPSSIQLDVRGNIYIATQFKDFFALAHYPQAFKKISVLSDSSRYSSVHILLPSLQPYYSLAIDTMSILFVKIAKKSDFFWFSGTSHKITTKKAFMDECKISHCAVLAKLLLPKSLQLSNKLSLQVDSTAIVLCKNEKVYLLPPLEAPPLIVHGRTLIPVRVLAETMGMNVSWVSVGQYIWLDRDGERLELQIGRNFAWKYALNTPEKKEKIEMDVPPMIVNNRTLLPLRFVTENFGALVDWNGFEQRILVSWE
jgi:hypothetical protein